MLSKFVRKNINTERNEIMRQQNIHLSNHTNQKTLSNTVPLKNIVSIQLVLEKTEDIKIDTNEINRCIEDIKIDTNEINKCIEDIEIDTNEKNRCIDDINIELYITNILNNIINKMENIIDTNYAEELKKKSHETKLKLENFFIYNEEDTITLKDNSNLSNIKKNILVLRNNMPKLEKIYSNLDEFIFENEDYLKSSIIKDNPVQESLILYDKPNNKYNNLFEIYKNWDKTLYSDYKELSINKHQSRLNNLNIEQGKITVITCIRNNLEYLKDSIHSLISQTGIGTDNWYNIIINDGSDDKIDLEIIFGDDFYQVKPYLNRITIVNNTEWKGVVGCQIQAIDLVQTEFVGTLDGDDRLEPDCLSEVLNKYNEYKDENIFVYTNFSLTDRYFNKTSTGFSRPPGKGLLFDGFALAFRSWRLTDYLKTYGYNPKFRYGGEDMDILYKLEKVARPVYIDKELYLYRRFDVQSQLEKDKVHLSLSKFHRYNCKIAKLVNAIERYGNIFHIKLYGRNLPKGLSVEEVEEYKRRFLHYKRQKKPFVFKKLEFYAELYLGDNLEYYTELLKTGTISDMIIKYFINNFVTTGQNKHRVYIEYSHQFNSVVLSRRPVDLSIDNLLKLHINNLYDEIYVSYNDNICNLDLDKMLEKDYIPFEKIISKMFMSEKDNNFFFLSNNLNMNVKKFFNINDITN